MRRKSLNPRFRIQRRLMVELPGLGKSGALERRPYPPGEHGLKRLKYSEYALQLFEKQKIRNHYVLRESQLKRFVREAKRTAEINWVSRLIGLLELRVDNVVFRLGFAPSIPAAKQLVSHGKVLVNGKRVDIRSAVLKVGDRIQLKAEAYQNQVYLQSKAQPRLELAGYLRKEEQGGIEIGIIQSVPAIEDLPLPIDAGLVTSYYSLKG